MAEDVLRMAWAEWFEETRTAQVTREVPSAELARLKERGFAWETIVEGEVHLLPDPLAPYNLVARVIAPDGVAGNYAVLEVGNPLKASP